MSWIATARAAHLRSTACVAFALFCAFGAGPAAAKKNGVDSTQMAGGVSSCGTGSCHFFPVGPDANLTVTILGPDTLFVDELETYTIEITGTFPPAAKGAGVHVAAFMDDVLTDIDDEILGAVTADSQITTFPLFSANGTGQFTHTNALVSSVGVYAYDFTVLAPADPGELRLEGAMNAFNGDGTSLFDAWQVTTKIISVPEPAAWLTQTLGALVLAALSTSRRRASRRRRAGRKA